MLNGRELIFRMIRYVYAKSQYFIVTAILQEMQEAMGILHAAITELDDKGSHSFNHQDLLTTTHNQAPVLIQ